MGRSVKNHCYIIRCDNSWLNEFLSYVDPPSFFFLWRYSPNLGHGLPPWNSPFHFGLLDIRHSVGHLGQVISSSQGLYLYTNIEKCTHTQHQTSMPWIGFEPTIPASERAKTVHALDCSATMMGPVFS
jgi:hypothetical protein